MKRIKQFLRDEAGLELSEYVVTGVLITLAIITAFTNVSAAIGEKINTLAGFLK